MFEITKLAHVFNADNPLSTILCDVIHMFTSSTCFQTYSEDYFFFKKKSLLNSPKNSHFKRN